MPIRIIHYNTFSIELKCDVYLEKKQSGGGRRRSRWVSKEKPTIGMNADVWNSTRRGIHYAHIICIIATK